MKLSKYGPSQKQPPHKPLERSRPTTFRLKEGLEFEASPCGIKGGKTPRKTEVVAPVGQKSMKFGSLKRPFCTLLARKNREATGRGGFLKHERLPLRKAKGVWRARGPKGATKSWRAHSADTARMWFPGLGAGSVPGFLAAAVSSARWACNLCRKADNYCLRV